MSAAQAARTPVAQRAEIKPWPDGFDERLLDVRFEPVEIAIRAEPVRGKFKGPGRVRLNNGHLLPWLRDAGCDAVTVGVALVELAVLPEGLALHDGAVAITRSMPVVADVHRLADAVHALGKPRAVSVGPMCWEYHPAHESRLVELLDGQRIPGPLVKHAAQFFLTSVPGPLDGWSSPEREVKRGYRKQWPPAQPSVGREKTSHASAQK